MGPGGRSSHMAPVSAIAARQLAKHISCSKRTSGKAAELLLTAEWPKWIEVAGHSVPEQAIQLEPQHPILHR